MDLRQLRYFATIAERGSFRNAASALNVAQSALTRHVQSLEADLGGPLFERGARGVTLSEAGQVLFERARFILAEVESARAEATAQTKALTGLLRLGAPSSFANVLFAPIAVRFSREHPALRLRMIEGLTLEMLDKLMGGAIDVAVITEPFASDHMECYPLFRERVYLIGQPDDPIFAKPTVSLSEISGLRFIQSSEYVRNQHQLHPGAVEADTVQSMKALVRAGLGYGLVPYSGVHDEMKSGAFGIVEVPDAACRRTLVVPKGRPMSRATRAILDAVREASAQLIAGGKLRVVD